MFFRTGFSSPEVCTDTDNNVKCFIRHFKPFQVSKSIGSLTLCHFISRPNWPKTMTTATAAHPDCGKRNKDNSRKKKEIKREKKSKNEPFPPCNWTQKNGSGDKQPSYLSYLNFSQHIEWMGLGTLVTSGKGYPSSSTNRSYSRTHGFHKSK